MTTPAVTELARAKVNLALSVVGRRNDGYHELDSVVAFAEVGDVLTFAPAGSDELLITGPFADALKDETDNIVGRARDLIRIRINVGPVAIVLQKNLPVASGIGGGSADAAATLRGLNRLAGAQLDGPTLQELAFKLGADVPVCIAQTACRMRGAGETLTAFAGTLPGAIVLVNPLAALSTKDVFAALALARGQSLNPALDVDHMPSWRNDLTAPAIRLLPIIANVLAALQDLGCFSTVRMSGSGATCFGLVEDLAGARHTASTLQQKHPDWWIVAARLG